MACFINLICKMKAKAIFYKFATSFYESLITIMEINEYERNKN